MQVDKGSLAEQRRMLREQLLAQRAVIAQQLDPVTLENGYPRSVTMRFLTEHSNLAGGLFTGAASLLVGGRYFKTISTALAVFKMVRTAVKNR